MHHVSPHSQTKTEQSPFALEDVTPFESAEEAWFWFMAAQDAKNDGAKFIAGAGLYKRPCEPLDILKVLDRLHFRPKEKRAYHLWAEALDRMGSVLIAKGIVEKLNSFSLPPAFISNEALSNEVAG